MAGLEKMMEAVLNKMEVRLMAGMHSIKSEIKKDFKEFKRENVNVTQSLAEKLSSNKALLIEYIGRIKKVETRLEELKAPPNQKRAPPAQIEERDPLMALDEEEILEGKGEIVMKPQFKNLEGDFPYDPDGKVRRRRTQFVPVIPQPPDEWGLTRKVPVSPDSDKNITLFGLNPEDYPVSSSSLMARNQYRQLLELSPSGVPDYFDDIPIGLFTWSLRDIVPMYIYNKTIREFTLARGVITNYIGSMMDTRQITTARHANPTRLFTLTDGKYKAGRIDDIYKFARSFDFERRVGVTERANKQQIYSLLSTVTSAGSIRINHRMRDFYETYDRKVTILDTEGQRVTQTEYYNSLITIVEVDLEEGVPDLETFMVTLRTSFYSIVELLRINHEKDFFKLEVRFAPEEKAITQYYTVFNGRGFFDILNPEHVKIEDNLLDTITAKNASSDSRTDDALYWFLDYQHYRVSVFDLERSGGCKGVHDLPEIRWATISETAEVKTQGCFIKILHVYLKTLFKNSSTRLRKIGKKYTTFWKYLDRELSTHTYQDGKNLVLIKVVWAERATRLFGINLFVYDYLGNIYDGGKDELKESDKILRVLLYKKHFYSITNYKPSPAEAKLGIEKIKKGSNLKSIPVYYDLETVYDCDPVSDHHLLPYSISYLIGDYSKNVSFEHVLRPDRNFPILFDKMLKDIKAHGAAYIARKHKAFAKAKVVTNTKTGVIKPFFIFYKMIAFNGANFDHHLLFAHLANAGYPIIYAPKNNKIHTFKAILADGVGIEVWDPAAFVRGSLANVAKAFNLKHQKGVFDHDVIQKAYEDGKFVSFIRENKFDLQAYNNLDVLVLKDITIKLKGLGLGVLHSPTLASLAFKLFRRTMDKEEMEGMRGFKDLEWQDAIRGSLIGGRTHIRREKGVPQLSHTFPELGVMIDVVSLYPFVMEEEKYPHGSYRVVADFKEVNKLWEGGEEGIWWCRVDQKPMEVKYEHCILPTLSEEKKGAKYLWDVFGKYEGYLPTITVIDLMTAGATVEIEEVIVWENFSDIFNTYVHRYKRGKEEEDRKRGRGLNTYNPVKRAMYKELMNSLSGKMCQREFLTTYGYYDLKKDGEAKVVNRMKENGADFDMVGNRGIFVKSTQEYESSKAYPVYIACFIYAYARSHMWREVFSKMKVWYTDTDSALIDIKDLSKINNLHIDRKKYNQLRHIRTQSEKKFGFFDVEGVCDKVYTPASKSYLMMYKGKIVKKRLKGVRKDDQIVFGEKIVGTLDISDEKNENYERNHAAIIKLFQTLVSGGFAEILTWSFRKCFRTATIRRLDMRKLLKV